MKSPIIGQTQGNKSSEHGLTKVAIYAITAVTGSAIALGYLSPEAAAQINDALSAFVYSVAGVVAAYTTARGVLKSVIAWQATVPEEIDE